MRNVIVTGGSRGLGLGIARRLTAGGLRAIVLARNETPELSRAREEISALGPAGDPLPFVPCDLTVLDRLPETVSAIRAQWGSIFGLVNNAGSSVQGLHAQVSAAGLEAMVKLNVTAPLLMCKYVLRAMMADGHEGSIVNISSVTALTGYSGLAAYSATKASLIGLTRSLAREVGPLGIRVNAVTPGFLETDLTRNITPDQRAKIQRRNALHRSITVEDVAETVAFLLSDQARSITGTVLTVDAGNTA